MSIDIKRRRLLHGMALSVPGAMLGALPAKTMAAVADKRTLTFYHTHTNDKLTIDYFSGHEYIHDSLLKINHFLRDFRTGDEYPIDPSLLDLLHKLKYQSGSRSNIQVISGYRSPKTNAALRNNSSGVAKRSLHMQGKAIDIRLKDVDTYKLRSLAIAQHQGGVGYYKSSDFIHVDTGRVRFW